MKCGTAFLYLVTILALTTGCSQTAKSYNFHYDIDNPDREKFVNNVLLFPAQIVVKEVFPGGVIEDMPSWSKMTNNIIIEELGRYLDSRLDIDSTVFRSENTTSTIRDHTALLKLINRSIRQHTRGWNSWSHKIARFDYEVGPGLSYLTSQNVDSALIITGLQTIEMARFDDSIATINDYRRDQLTFGTLYINVSLIDLRSGYILWNNMENFDGIDVRKSPEVNAMLMRFFSTFPVSLYRNN